MQCALVYCKQLITTQSFFFLKFFKNMDFGRKITKNTFEIVRMQQQDIFTFNFLIF